MSRTVHGRAWRWRNGVVCLATAVSLFACGGKQNAAASYQGAMSKSEACCRGLGNDAAEAECLKALPRVDDPETQRTDVNRQTFACVDKNFVCEPATGHATKDSAQAQLDCISELESGSAE